MADFFLPTKTVFADRLASAAMRAGAADWLCLTAAPTFALMALLTGVRGDGPPDVLCAAALDASPLSGMALMYLLMSAFHLAPWLRLASSRRSGASGPGSGIRQVGRCRQGGRKYP